MKVPDFDRFSVYHLKFPVKTAFVAGNSAAEVQFSISVVLVFFVLAVSPN